MIRFNKLLACICFSKEQRLVPYKLFSGVRSSMVEHQTFNLSVPGSSPGERIFDCSKNFSWSRMMVEFVETDDCLVCFVNSDKIPDKVERLPSYSCSEVDGELRFSQLCRYTYVHEEQIQYKLLIWEPIEVPKHKRALLKMVCDAMRGFQ